MMNRVSPHFGSVLASGVAGPVVALVAERQRRVGDNLGLVCPNRSVPASPSTPLPGGIQLVHAFSATRSSSSDSPSLEQSSWQLGIRKGVVLSTLFHAAVFVVILWNTQYQGMGVGGVELEGISVEIITTAALESMTQPRPAAAQTPSAPEDRPPLPAPPEQPVTPPNKADEARVETAEKPAEDITRRDEPQVPIPVEPPPSAVDKPLRQPDAVKPHEVAGLPPQPDGGAAGSNISTNDTNAVSNGAAGASQGSLSRYAVEIRIALGKHRPRHGGARGRAIVSFTLDAEGRVKAATIIRASGSSALDEAALSAVIGGNFPPPPDGTTDTQRTFIVPFDFK